MSEPEKFPVKLRFTLAILGTLYLVLVAMVFWLGAPEQNAAIADATPAAAMPAPSAGTAATTLPLPAAPSTAANSAAPIRKIDLSPDQRQLLLGEITKAANKDMLRVRRDIEKSRTAGAPAAEISAQENKLRNMQAVLQQVQDKNRPAE